jgi:hypothetical protein
MQNTKVRVISVLTLFALILSCSAFVYAQGTGATGSIQGTVTDPSGAVVPNAKVEITSQGTGRTQTLTTTGNGYYTSGQLIPGEYVVKVTAPGFEPVQRGVAVQIGATSNGNIKVGLQQSTETVNVEAEAIRVNTEQATVQGVLTAQQIEALPMNGRNFLDLAQVEPGVQIENGSNFDPTKGGFSGISIGGRSGRTTRIELDGQDISDETVGTTVTNVSASSIQEFNIAQSSLDPSSELTSSGIVNVATRTGTNAFHGEGFYLFRDKELSANFPGDIKPPYQRNQFGGRLGGPIVKDHLFFFLSGERVRQVLGVPLNFDAPFQALSGTADQPFREKTGLAKVDWAITASARAFYRINYDNLTATSNTLSDFSIFNNLNNTPAHAAGLDFTTGRFTHSIRYGYLKFQNHISDATGGGVLNLIPGAQVRVSSFRTGVNPLAPQATFQSNNQIKYDGTTLWGKHQLRYGVGFNHILGGGFANFFGLGPSVRSTNSSARQAIADAGPFPGGRGNPLNYPVSQLVLGNGQGFFTETPGFGLDAGGQHDNRLQLYVADSWKIWPSFTFTASLRYLRDTGRTNSDLPPIPCSAIDTSLFSPLPTCNGNLFDMFGEGLGNKVRQDNNNFAPSLGFAWDVGGAGKTVVRAGAGMYYENAIFNNVLFSRPIYLQNGLFNDVKVVCGAFGSSVQFPSGPVTTTPTGKDIGTQICGQPIGSVASDVIALQNALIAANNAAGAGLNPQFVGETLNPNGALAPDYRSPYSFQMNFGLQQQLGKSTVLSADYIRNVNLHYLVGIDTNHVGDAAFFNKTAAINAITATNASFGCPAGAAGIDCAIAAGAVMTDYGANGLTSASAYCAGPCNFFGLPADQGAAFPGINPLVGSNVMYFPSGRSVYNALQFSLRSQTTNPFPYASRMLKRVNYQLSYALSKFQAGTNNDQDFIAAGFDYRNPNRYLGWSTFDRKHQIGWSTTFEMPWGIQFSTVGKIASPLSSSLFVESTFDTDDIFVTDFTGDGTTQDPIPGTVNGSFMRQVQPGQLANLLDKYNSTVAGTPTPAGQVLIDQGLLTLAQLQALGGVAKEVTLSPDVPRNEVASNGWLRVIDLKLAFPIKITERVRLEPSVTAFNAFNFANIDVSPNNRLGSVLDQSAGSVNGTNRQFAFNGGRNSERAAQTSSLFGAGAPRQLEFGLRLTF